MKRRLLPILLFLILGVLVNVIIAWAGEVNRSRVYARTIAVLQMRVKPAGSIHIVTPPDVEPIRIRMPKPPARASHPSGMAAGTRGRCIQVRSGWPLASLSRDVHRAPCPLSSGSATSSIRTGLVIQDAPTPLNLAPPLHLAVRPVWPGLAVNTALFAFILWMLLAATPRAVRRQIRRRRGRCIKCGYDLRGEFVAGSPECGWNREEATI